MKALKKRLLRSLALALAPPIGALFIRTLYATCKKEFHIAERIGEESVIFAFWHGDLLFPSYLYSRFRKKPRAKVLISDHFDGKIIAKVISYFGFETIEGSTNRSAVKALIGGIKALREGYDVGITPDGPKGPRYTISDGVVAMAQKSGAKVVVFSCVPSKYWQFRSWDRFVVAKPFAKLDFYASKALDVSDMELEDAKRLISEELMRHAID